MGGPFALARTAQANHAQPVACGPPPTLDRMGDASTLSETLKHSEAYKSLRAEQIVAASLTKYGWRTTHGPYYVDIQTGKARELDVAAHAYWQKERAGGELTARVNLFVEVKTNSDFHILCAGRTKDVPSFGSNEFWIGYSLEAHQTIKNRLAGRDYKTEDVLDYLHRVEKLSFPKNHMRTAVLRLKPPPARYAFSTFRETNGKIEKELDNSVLWRATLGVRSAVRAAQREKIDGLAIDFESDVEVARRYKRPLTEAIGSIESHARRIDLYLPVVVLQSRIWSAESESPVQLDWVRLVQHGTFGSGEDWIDVVNLDHLEAYLKTQVEHFESAFKRARAKRWM